MDMQIMTHKRLGKICTIQAISPLDNCREAYTRPFIRDLYLLKNYSLKKRKTQKTIFMLKHAVIKVFNAKIQI